MRQLTLGLLADLEVETLPSKPVDPARTPPLALSPLTAAQAAKMVEEAFGVRFVDVAAPTPPAPAATPVVMTEALRDARVLALLQELNPLLPIYARGPRNSSLRKLAFLAPSCVRTLQRKKRST